MMGGAIILGLALYRKRMFIELVDETSASLLVRAFDCKSGCQAGPQ